jgi:integrase
MGQRKEGNLSSQHLLKRGSRLYFRLAIPLDLLPLFDGRRELRTSLKTKCYSTAKGLARLHLGRAERLFLQLRSGIMTTEEIRKLVAAYFECTLAEAENARADGSGVLEDYDEDGEHGVSSVDGLDLHLSDLMENLARGKHEAAANVADLILEGAGITLDKGSHDYRVLCREALKGAIDATRVELARTTGHYGSSLPSLERQDEVPAVSASSKPAVLLSAAVAEYVTEHAAGGHWTKKTQAESEGIYKLLVGIAGDRDMSELDYKALSGFRDTLLKFPSNVSKRRAYRGKEISEILTMKVDKTLSVSSVNKHIIRVGAFLKWAVKRGYVAANFAEGLTITKRGTKESEEREAYLHEDLLSLVRSPLAGFWKARPERFWIPILGLYSGARLNELCQLSVEDVREEDSLLCLDINDKGADKRLKNASSRRVIPVHPILLELGFKEYAEGLRGKGAVRLWPALRKGRDGYGHAFGKWFQGFNRRYVTTNRKRVFHSFRHCLADGLKQRGVDGNIIAEILGHSLGNSISLSRYGKAYGPKVLLEALRKLDYGVEEELREWPRLG